MTRRSDQAADQAVKAAEIAAEASRQSRLGAAEAGLAASEAELAKEEARRERESPGDRLRATELPSRLGEWASRRVSPRRRRHEKLGEYDERVRDLEARSGMILREQAELREQIPAAEADYQQALSGWLREGSKGERPRSRAREIEERVRELADEHEAVQTLIGEVFEEKTRWVERNRSGLVKDAADVVREAEAGYRAAIDRLLGAREEVVDARLDEIWTKLYPHDVVASTPPPVALVGGIPSRLRAIVPGLQAPIAIADLRRLLEADAELLPTLATPQQREALRAAQGLPPHDAVTWAGTRAHEEQVRREREEARERYRREWGRNPDS